MNDTGPRHGSVRCDAMRYAANTVQKRTSTMVAGWSSRNCCSYLAEDERQGLYAASTHAMYTHVRSNALYLRAGLSTAGIARTGLDPCLHVLCLVCMLFAKTPTTLFPSEPHRATTRAHSGLLGFDHAMRNSAGILIPMLLLLCTCTYDRYY